MSRLGSIVNQERFIMPNHLRAAAQPKFDAWISVHRHQLLLMARPHYHPERTGNAEIFLGNAIDLRQVTGFDHG